MNLTCLKSRCRQGRIPSGGSREGVISLTFPASVGCLHSFRLTAPSSVLKACSVVAASDLTWGRSSSCKDSWLHWVHLDSPRYAPHLKVLNHIWKIPLPHKVTYSWVLEMRRGPLWVLWSAFHTVESKDETLVQDKLLTGDLMKVISSSHYFFMTKFTTQCVPTPHTHKKTRGQVPARKTGDQMGTDLEWW